MPVSDQLLSFRIQPESIEPSLSKHIEEYLQHVDQLLEQEHYDWQNLMAPLAELDVKFHRFWSPISHLNSVNNTDALRDAYNQCIPQLSSFSTKMGQNEQLFHAIASIEKNAGNLDHSQKTILKHNIRDFKLSGVHLNNEQKTEYKALSQELASLTTQFQENIMDATDAFSIHITDSDRLSGIPDYALAVANSTAQAKSLQGAVFTLQLPSYIAVMQYADDRELRQQMHYAFATRASDVGPHAGQFDNSQILFDILCKRKQLSELLGFSDYAEYSLATKMINQPQQVLDFLNELATKAYPRAQQEKQELIEFAQQELGIDTLEPWDLSYVAEKMKQRHYNISDQELRPYFPAPQVISGLFTIVQRLFNVNITAVEQFDRWHDDVTCYLMSDQDGTPISYFYFDLYAREKKRGGAWMDDAQTRYLNQDQQRQLPIAFVVCNFNPPVANQAALLSHDDVVTLFHEVGHSLQHMLTEIDYSEASGLNGIPWDAVEVCSQFLENWAWQKECMPLISAHHDTGEPLPDTLFERMQKARCFQSAMQMMRQIQFSLFDFIIHQQFNPTQDDAVQHTLDQVRKQTEVFPSPDYSRFQHSFSHIFAGGYAAGYYSYKWAEVMAADAFGLFLENGIFDQHTSQAFRKTFLASGGTQEPLDLFVEFRGREPSVDALLQQYGIT